MTQTGDKLRGDALDLFVRLLRAACPQSAWKTQSDDAPPLARPRPTAFPTFPQPPTTNLIFVFGMAHLALQWRNGFKCGGTHSIEVRRFNYKME